MKRPILISALAICGVIGAMAAEPLLGTAVEHGASRITVGETIIGTMGATDGMHLTHGRVQGIIELADIASISGGLEVNVDVSVYPNPTPQILYVNREGEGTEASLTITSMAGVNVFGATLRDNHSSLDLSQLPAGVYLLTIEENSQLLYKSKIIKR